MTFLFLWRRRRDRPPVSNLLLFGIQGRILPREHLRMHKIIRIYRPLKTIPGLHIDQPFGIDPRDNAHAWLILELNLVSRSESHRS